MRTVLRASLRRHTRRYVAAAVAVTIGVAFIVVTNALSSSVRNGMVAGVQAPYADADVVVSDIDGHQAGKLVERARKEGDHVSVLGWSLQRVGKDGHLIADRVDVGAVTTDPTMRWQTLEDGRFPTGPGEAVADYNDAKSNDVEVGDTLQVGSGDRAVDVRVVGMVDSASSVVSASLYITWPDLHRWASGMYVDSVAYAGSGSVDDQIRAIESDFAGATVETKDDFVTTRQAELTEGVDVLALSLLLFAAIALFVSVMVIANTFSILFTQRLRDFALLRCVGATRKQVLRSVRIEALVIGIVASFVGLVLGTGVGYGLVALTERVIPSAAMGAVEMSVGWYLAAFVVGVGVTLVASWLPTRRVVRVSPLVALRPDDGIDARTTAGRLRIATGFALGLIGVAALTVAVLEQSTLSMVAGGAAFFAGVLLLGPILVPALVRVVGVGVGRFLGPAGRLATGNAVRNPRRTAATTASLLVGITLTTAMLTGMASSRDAVGGEMDQSHPIDATLTSTGTALPAGLLDQVADTPGVDGAVALNGTTAEISGGLGTLELIAPTGASRVVHGSHSFSKPARGEIYVPYDTVRPGASYDDRVTVTVDGRKTELKLRTGDGWGEAGLVAPATLQALTDAATPRAVWVLADPDTDAEDLAGDLDSLAAPVDAELSSGFSERAYVYLQLDIMTGAVVALLGIAVVIALIGIGNTLGLSVLERGREHALLRAMGLTRRQLRGTLAIEAVLLSVVGTMIGTVLGVAFAWVGVQAMVKQVVDDAPIVLPFGQLAIVVLVAAVSGLLSCLLPSRRAARLSPAAGLALD